MNPRLRLGIFLIGGVGLAMLFVAAFAALPGPVEQRDRYAEQIIGRTFVERNITDAVTAVNFDYRGFDTLGEEFILFVAVMGTLVLLREPEEKRQRLLPDAITPDRDVPPTDATRLWTLVMAAPKVLFGVYIVTHGQLSPGGGFQGGVVLATAALLLYL